MNTLLFHLRQRDNPRGNQKGRHKGVDGAFFKPINPETKGPSIRQLQQNLNHRLAALGVLDVVSVRVDGWFGPQTVASVKYLQCVGGLPVNGQVNRQTHAFIQQGTAGLSELSLGSRGLGVLALKQVLAAETEITLDQDDRFCQQTEWAVMVYQRKLGFRCDGVVGAKTWEGVVRSRLKGIPCAVLLPNTYKT